MSFFGIPENKDERWLEAVHNELNKHFETLLPFKNDKVTAKMFAGTYALFSDDETFIKELGKRADFVKMSAFPKRKSPFFPDFDVPIYDILSKGAHLDECDEILDPKEFIKGCKYNFHTMNISGTPVSAYFFRNNYDFNNHMPFPSIVKLSPKEEERFTEYQLEYLKSPMQLCCERKIPFYILEDKDIRKALKTLYIKDSWPFPEPFFNGDKGIIYKMYNSRFKFFNNPREVYDFARKEYLNINNLVANSFVAKEGFFIVKSRRTSLPNYTKSEFSSYCMLLRSQFRPPEVENEINILKKGLNF